MSHIIKRGYDAIEVLKRLGYNEYDAEREISHCILRCGLEIHNVNFATTQEIFDLFECMPKQKRVGFGHCLATDVIDDIETVLLQYIFLKVEELLW